MKSIRKLLFGLREKDKDSVKLCNFDNFKMIQNIRLSLMLLLVVLILMLIFVIVKLVFVYFICWAVIFMLVAMAMLSCAAGRQRLEQKMLDKLNRQNAQGEENNDSSMANRLLVKKRLPEEERTMYWRTAIRHYEIALPFYLASLWLFYYRPLQFDIACELVFIKCSGEAKENKLDPAGAYNTCVENKNGCPGTNQTLASITS